MKMVIKTKDAVEGSWVYQRSPSVVRPYLKLARMDRPVGTWLLLWPAVWSILLASFSLYPFNVESFVSQMTVPLIIIFLFAVGALVMRGAGCTYNDIIDRDFDAQVDRTKSRPLPAGEVSVKAAWLFLTAQCLIGFGVLLLLSSTAIYLGFASLILVAAYPFMKRITYWPQVWLGLTFNWGALMGWAAMTDRLEWPAVVLYIGGIFWTLGYDTIYAHQDAEDDALIGVKSSALALGAKTPLAVGIFYSFFIICLIGVGILAKAGIFYYIGLVIAAGHLFWQVRTIQIDDGDLCLRLFRSNIKFGWIFTASLLAGYAF